MALTSWKGNVVRKGDIFTAKNYLTHEEIDTLNRLTVLFLDSAEMRVKERKDLTLDYWKKNVDNLLEFQGKEILHGAGSISNKQMEAIVGKIYDDFNRQRKLAEAQQADADDLRELRQWEEKIISEKQ